MTDNCSDTRVLKEDCSQCIILGFINTIVNSF